MFESKKVDEVHRITGNKGHVVATIISNEGLVRNIVGLLNLQLKDLKRQVEAATGDAIGRRKLSDVEWQVLGILGGSGESDEGGSNDTD